MKKVNHIVRYQIHLEQPLRMGQQGSQANTVALDYIAGSTIRGAIIGVMLNGKKSIDKDYDSLFVNTRYTDAYLRIGNKLTVPVPAVFYADKHAVRKASDKNPLQMNLRLDKPPVEGEIRVDYGKFCTLNGSQLTSYTVAKTGNLHINRSSDDMFRFEAIERNQDFVGFIICENETEAKAYSTALNEQKVLYLGGSKTSGYGRCTVSCTVTGEDEMMESYGIRRTYDKNQFVLYALSNLYLYDEFGRITGTISASLLKEKLGLESVTPGKTFVTTFRTAGYNHTWKAGNVQAAAVKGGSCFVFTYKGTIDPEKVKALEADGIGSRKQEGFGRIIIGADFADLTRTEGDSTFAEVKEAKLTEESAKILKMIQNNVNEDRILSHIRSQAEAANAKEFELKKLQTQISKLYGVLNNAIALYGIDHGKTAKAAVESFIAGMKKPQNNSEDAELVYKNDSAKKLYDNALFQVNGQYRKMEELLREAFDDRVKYGSWFSSQLDLWGEASVVPYTDTEMKLMYLREWIHSLMRKGGKH